MASDRDTLPDTVKPTNYYLSVYDLESSNPWQYQGTVKIALEIKKSAKEIVLNTHQLKIHSVELSTEQTKTELASKASNISYDTDKQRATLSFDDEFPVSSKACLDIKFQGTINNHMAGFYRSRYKPVVEAAKSVPRDDEYHYMYSTQFESCDARRAFPSFDEPNLKATFDFEIEIPDDQTALSNMPEKSTRKGSKDGLKVVTFEQTPIMSTYLLAWAVGDFEYVEDFTKRKYNGKNLPVRVYTTKGLKEQGRFALENAHKIVDYFSDIFKIDYPLPKVDLLAVHEFSHGAMENWGLITYRTTALLFDEKQSDQRYKNRVAYVVAHELAHQWFGNLVTMDWWNELWLNEGFATWVGWLAIDHLHPEWEIWSQFVSEAVQTAFQLDAIRNSHPIEVPVRNALEVDQVFDHISYLKGSSVIRMLSAHLGAETFLNGVSLYLNAHTYSNATTNDLWSALSKASGQDVNSFMDPWVRKIGFPVVKIAEEPGQIGIRQSRFLTSGDVKPEEDETLWWIPLSPKYGADFKSAEHRALTVKEESIKIDETFYKINTDQTGFYRTNYPPERLKKLGEARNKLSTEDKIGLVGDAAALAHSGDGTTAAFLALIELFQDEPNYLVWQQITNSLRDIGTVFSDIPAVSKGLKKFQLKLVTPAAEKIGWDFPEGEDLLTGRLRALLISQAGLAGHEKIVAEAKKRFEAYTAGNDTSAIHPSLRSAVFGIVIHHGDKDAYEAVKKYYSTTISTDGKEIALQALGHTQAPDLVQDLLAFTFSAQVAVQDRHTTAIALAANARGRGLLWAYVKAHWDDAVFPSLSGNMVVLERFLRAGLNKFASFDVERDIRGFFADKDTRGFDRGLAVVADTVTAAATYKERDAALVEEWLGAYGYLA